MALEDLTGADKFINDFIIANPVGSTDFKSSLDNHIRGIKNVLKNQFPNLDGAVSASDEELNFLVGLTGLAAPIDAPSFTGIADFAGQVRWSKGVDVASAAALNLGADGNMFDITGTADITSIITEGVGSLIILHFDDVLTFTHHATDLILPESRDIVTYAGLVVMLYEYAVGDWRYVASNYTYRDPILTNHKRVGNMQLAYNNEPGAILSADAVITEATWESIGPTGSGADNIWTAMDILPASAKVLIVDMYMGAINNTTGAGSIQVYAEEGDVAVPSHSFEDNVVSRQNITSGAVNDLVIRENRIFFILGDTNQDFQMRYSLTNTYAETIDLYYRGFMTDN